MSDLSDIEELYLAALEQPPEARSAFLAVACRDNPALRAEVERLLAAHVGMGRFLEPPASSTAGFDPAPPAGVAHPPTATFGDSAVTADHPSRDEGTGTIIAGRYKLIEEIGEGGMGSVWMAQQTEPVKRTVAVKLIKAGMDSKAVLARFEAERQALALMDHPNIAKVLDAGATPDGRPYFVMELVKGVPITKYCDQKKLTPKERLELFVPVCQAIQHAHQKGIIHRDIKPSNVLVALYDDRPVPKVIDFGVAKAAGQTLTEKTLATGFGAVVGTPEYMSPEQASFNNLDIDTRSDVYALGVLLYELLAGSPPFSKKELEKVGLLEIFRVIREQEPPKPSTKLSTADALPTLSANRGTEPKRLKALLRGELDWIVMKSLEKDRSRRYETANGFAADVLRYLAGEPVLAVPPSAGYRLRKFLRRNRGPVTAAGLVFAALTAGISIAAWQAVVAESARRDAIRAQGEEAKERGRAEGEWQRAETNAAEARTHLGEARHLLGSMATKEGLRLADSGDVAGGLLWFVEALARDPENAAAAETTRHRIAMYERHALTARLASLILTDQPVRPTHTHESSCLSPDGQRCMVLTDSELQIRDTATGRVLRRASRGKPGEGVDQGKWCFSPDCKRVLLPYSNEAHLIDIDSGDRQPVVLMVRSGPDKGNAPEYYRGGSYYGAQFSRDGRLLVTLSSTQSIVWDSESGQSIGDPLPGTGFGANQGRRTAAFTPDGRKLVLAHPDKDRRPSKGVFASVVQVYDTETLRPIGPPAPANHHVECVAFSPDGRHFAYVTNNGFLHVCRVGSSEPVFPAIATGGLLTHVEYAPTGQQLLVRARGQVHVFSPTTGSPIWSQGFEEFVFGRVEQHFSPDGLCVLTFGQFSARLWDAATGRPVSPELSQPDAIRGASFDATGRHLVTVGERGAIRHWEVNRPEPGRNAYPRDKLYICFGSDFGWYTTPGANGLWSARDTTTHALIFPPTPYTNHRMAAPTDDGRFFAFLTAPETVVVWDMIARRQVGPPLNHAGPGFPGVTAISAMDSVLRSHVKMLRLSPAGKWVVTQTAGGTPSAWSSATGQRVDWPNLGNGPIWPVFSRDDRLVARLAEDDATYVWDTETGRQVCSPIRGVGAPSGMFWVSGNKLLIIRKDPEGGWAEGRVWDVTSGQAVGSAIRSEGRPIELSTDFRHAAGTSAPDGAIRFWDTATCQPIGEPVRLAGRGRVELLLSDSNALISVPGQSQWLFDYATGRVRQTPSSVQVPTSITAFKSDGRWWVASQESQTRLLDAASWEPVSPAQSALGTYVGAEGSKFVFSPWSGVYRVVQVVRTDRPVEELRLLARAWSGRRLDENGVLVNMSPEEHKKVIEEVETRFPGEVRATPDQVNEWHRERAADAENTRDASFAAAFHLRILLRDAPGDADLSKRLAEAERQIAALEVRLNLPQLAPMPHLK